MTEDNEIRVRRRSIDEYRKDPKNANVGTERGDQLLRASAEKLRAGRSLLADAGDTFIGGNHMSDALAAAGITTVIEIETTGDEAVVVKRVDMQPDSPERDQMAVADNWTQHVNYAPDAQALIDNPDSWAGWIREDEIDEMLSDQDIAAMVNDSLDTNISQERALGDRKKQVKPVLYVDEVAIFEQALKATGLRNRGQALMVICRAYLEGQGDEA
jgi:hypothetical protein